ncbi:2634_t:CDS:2 [Racocetra persica]|uniref:2634_t:CDS:1 n=1 Tax=Racocetra persica TaxID=160502 RepID=A0ACA9NRP2_9GLOM|nr:2634_t:CDS:2 [Racocetra persica]
MSYQEEEGWGSKPKNHSLPWGDDVEYKIINGANGYGPKLPEVKSQEWKEKIKYSNCSIRCKAVYHDKGEQCPKTYSYSDSKQWNNDWAKIKIDFEFFYL